MNPKTNYQLDESISQLTHILELISDDLQYSDQVEHRFLIDIKQEIGGFIERIMDRQKSFDDQCFDPELGDQGAIYRSIGKKDKVSEYVRSTIKNVTGLLYGDSVE